MFVCLCFVADCLAGVMVFIMFSFNFLMVLTLLLWIYTCLTGLLIYWCDWFGFLGFVVCGFECGDFGVFEYGSFGVFEVWVLLVWVWNCVVFPFSRLDFGG